MICFTCSTNENGEHILTSWGSNSCRF